MTTGADTGVGCPQALVAVEVTSYVVPAARPVRTQSAGTKHVTVVGEPPPMGDATSVYGPVTPGAGDMSTLIEPDPVTAALSTGAPTAGVTMVAEGEGGVGRPVAISTPETATV